jgi:hypothetical protein
MLECTPIFECLPILACPPILECVPKLELEEGREEIELDDRELLLLPRDDPTEK